MADGILTDYEVLGSGPPILMLSPGGFDATAEKWRTQGIYKTLDLLGHLPSRFTCIVFDRRETGGSGGRIERIGWHSYAAQAAGLLDNLGLDRVHLLGGCMGCSVATTFAALHPDRVRSLVLFWPVGGARYRINGHRRFAEHLTFVRQNGLQAVVDLARGDGSSFGADPRGGPWVMTLKQDDAFAAEYVRQDPEHYAILLAGTARLLMDRDTAPGAEPEDLLRLDCPALIVPGEDAAHATSAARYLQECLPGSHYWNAPVAEQTGAKTLAILTEFLSETKMFGGGPAG